MRIGRMAGIFLASLIGCALLTVTGFAVRAAYQQSLGPPLEPVVVPPTPTLIPVADAQAAPPTPTLAPAPAAAVCGETEAWNLLVIGADTILLRGDMGSDLTRLVRLDFPNRKVVIYAFSRDLWVNTSGLGLTNPTVDATELGTVFYEAFRRSNALNHRLAMVAGVNTMAQMLAWNFAVTTDHYMAVDVIRVPGMIDAIGGIPINVPTRVTDPWIGMVIQPGQQTFTGTQAVAYARAKPDSDFGRINRQKLLLEAMRQRLRDPAVWAKIPQLYAQYADLVATDLSPEQINHISCLLNELPAEAIIQDGVNQSVTSAGPRGSYLWDKNAVLLQLQALGLAD